jgi:hypothetical protein
MILAEGSCTDDGNADWLDRHSALKYHVPPDGTVKNRPIPSLMVGVP